MKLPKNFFRNQFRLAHLKFWFYIGLVFVAVGEIILPRLFHGAHGHFWFENLPGWGAIYGLFSCMVIIVVSKLIGKALLLRREEYYDS